MGGYYLTIHTTDHMCATTSVTQLTKPLKIRWKFWSASSYVQMPHCGGYHHPGSNHISNTIFMTDEFSKLVRFDPNMTGEFGMKCKEKLNFQECNSKHTQALHRHVCQLCTRLQRQTPCWLLCLGGTLWKDVYKRDEGKWNVVNTDSNSALCLTSLLPGTKVMLSLWRQQKVLRQKKIFRKQREISYKKVQLIFICQSVLSLRMIDMTGCLWGYL